MRKIYMARALVTPAAGGMYGPGQTIPNLDPDDDHDAALIAAGLIRVREVTDPVPRQAPMFSDELRRRAAAAARKGGAASSPSMDSVKNEVRD